MDLVSIRIAIATLLIILLDTSTATKDNSHESQTFYIKMWPKMDLKTSASYQYGVGGYFPKGGFSGFGGLGGGYLPQIGLSGFGGLGNYGGYGGYGGGSGGYGGGYGGLNKGLRYASGHSDLGAQNQLSGYESGAGQKGQSGLQSAQGYSGAEDIANQNEQSAGFYGGGSGSRNNYEKGGAYQGGSNFGQAGEHFHGNRIFIYLTSTM